MIKLFASDLDGTLLNLFHTLDGTIRASIEEVVRSGAHFAIATGRTMHSNHEYGFDGLEVEAVVSNGALIYGRDGAILKYFTMDPAFLEEMLTAFPQVCFECVGVDRSYVTGSYEDQMAGFSNDGPLKRIVMRGMRKGREEALSSCLYDQSTADILSRPICKVNCRVHDEGLEAELHAFLDEHADTVVNTPFSPTMFEISDVGTNKGAGVAWLAGYLGFSEDEVAVYGDGGNDVVMLERFEHSYATREACDEAKAAAAENIGSCALHAVPHHMVRTVREQAREPRYTQVE